MNTDHRYKQSPDAVSTEPEPGKRVLLQLETGHYHALNETGSTLWSAMSEPVTAAALSRLLQEQYGIESTLADADVRHFLEGLLERGLVVSA